MSDLTFQDLAIWAGSSVFLLYLYFGLELIKEYRELDRNQRVYSYKRNRAYVEEVMNA
jgi:hypothetical protein